ncbi:MAG TPA: NTP transferase domain-containing protein [Actinomycetota bacterium]|nr:NTP transferase domain-containing protein [Actinomycetota bacterium]
MRQADRTVEVLGRPTTGIVLAAGQSERLRTVTGGGSKALVRLGGLRLVERAIRTLLALGLERVVVVVGYHAGPVAAVARRAAPGRVQVVEAPEWREGNGASLAAAEPALADDPSFVLMTADHVFADGALDGLVATGQPAVLVDPDVAEEEWEEATKVRLNPRGDVVDLGKALHDRTVDCGAFLLPAAVFDAARASRAKGDASLSGAVAELAGQERVVAVPLRSGTWWQDIDTPADLRRAGRLLRRSLPRPTDGPVSRLLNRRLSVPVSWLVARLPVSPDVLSAVSFLFGLAGAVLLALGQGVAGGALAQACSILDGVDGEVARLTLRAGPRGTLLDGYLDRLGDVALCAGLGLWAVDQGASEASVVLLVVAATAGAVLSMATKDRVAALGLEPPSERRLGWVLGGRDGRLLLIFILAAMGRPLWALGVTGATSLLSSALRVGFARNPPP